MPITTNLKKKLHAFNSNILKPHSAHIIGSNIVSCNEKFYTIFMNFKTKFKIFSLKSPPLPKQ